MKISERYNPQTMNPDNAGRLFANNLGIFDLSHVEIIGASVDTVRQLYYGLPQMFLIERLEENIEQQEKVFNLSMPTKLEPFKTVPFSLTKMGKVARYRFKLQNNELGIVILFGSYFNKLDSEGQHLKIELSPHFIACRDSHTIQAVMDDLAHNLMKKSKPQGVAVHLACDYQNYSLSPDFLQYFSTYSRTIRIFDGVGEIDLSDISEAIASYGTKKQERNYLIGKASAVQLCLYDKSREIIKSDKVDYFHNEWGVYSFGAFDVEKTVRRIEARLHHQVVREVGQGLGQSFESFAAIADYLTDIWRYALRINRLNAQHKGDLVNPFWQLLLEDVFFYVPAKNIDVKRKKKASIDPVARNITSLVGNFISLCVRQAYNADDIMIFLKAMPVYPRIKQYYKLKGKNEQDIRDYIKESVIQRRLTSRLEA